jgi:hypothetical protein
MAASMMRLDGRLVYGNRLIHADGAAAIERFFQVHRGTSCAEVPEGNTGIAQASN